MGFSFTARRQVLSTIAGAVLSVTAAGAFAAAPIVGTQAPGYYRTMLGDFEVTVLSDGTVDLPMDKLLQAKPAQLQQAFTKNFVKAPVETSVNTFLINTGSKLVLVDTGAGGLFGPTLGKLLANLKAAGYQPEQVDEIYITHLHPDHIGGLGAGQSVFPNAVVRADRHDADYWLSKSQASSAPADKQGYFQGAQNALAPYVGAKKFVPFDGSTELVPGIRATSSYGHTPGHTSYVVESRGQKLVLIGDLIHANFIQFDDPTVTIAFDSDSKTALAARQAGFAEAARSGYLIGAAHLPFPALGHLRSSGKGYQFVPVSYSVPR
ncbi:glyoxylase-like metal-dependent hydrolase (beta-lactamase superfamily II) [Pseudoduganella lurida]|uniref:Glyoxylase-like metal-dependent hydrolase (Beta-lactamase superfamily II) n=1 Tax=Pseudoduganella lurida TaxID=1036180 RepID=A0A562RKP5_9BURK|nr:MBL fold metallo-hydrolase [Pseudoduganella lurida]TWI69609.1 glyoxylase-like metal-dependent hydrolase (beta-lactamase superfamily II) [Pseudoduganella lurida]